MLKVIEYIDSWFMRILCVSFFLTPKIQTFIFIFFSIFCIFKALKEKIKLSKLEIFTAFFLGCSYLFYVFYIPFTESSYLHELYSLLERKISLLILPFILLLYSKSTKCEWNEDIKWFAYANIIHGILINLLVFFKSLDKVCFQHVDYRVLFEDLGGIHPTYYGMYICFSIAVILWQETFEGKFKLQMTIISQIILILFLLLLSPKISLLIAILIYIFYIFQAKHISIKYKLVMPLAGFIVLFVSYLTIPFFQQRIGELVVLYTNHNQTGLDNSIIIRKFIFDVDVYLLKLHWIKGIGPVALQHQLDNAFAFSSFIIKTPLGTYNTHNEYLNQWLSFGVLGIIYFITYLIVHIRKAFATKNAIYVVLMLIMLITCLTENILSRQHGILFVGFFTSMFYFSKIKNNNINPKINI